MPNRGGPARGVVAACLVRNEAHRYWSRVLSHLSGQVDGIVVVDDGSTDSTPLITDACPAVVEHVRLSGGEMWGRESPARQLLWETASRHGDWILINDADQILVGDVRQLTASPNINAWAFVLYDLWDDDETLYREDGFWRGHLVARPWLFRANNGGRPVEWGGRGIHTGHAPANFPYRIGEAPRNSYYWLHFGYCRASDRDAKLSRYRSQYHQMTEFEQAHAESIADPSPSLRILPFAKPIKILVGGPVRKDPEILAAHLKSLAWQEKPKRVEVSYCFVDDYPEQGEGSALLVEFVNQHGGKVLKSPSPDPNDFSDTHPVTHQWTPSAMNRVGQLKHGIFTEALKGGYDFVWLVDSDLVLDKTVLKSLVSAQKPVVSAVYWTRWNADPAIHAGPQVWLKPIYQLSLPHYPESEFRANLGVKRNLEKVGGLGACTLIARHVIEKGVGFGKPPGFPEGGLWDGEDRHFCEWARRLHVDLYADAWPDIFHVYHTRDKERLPAMVFTLGADHPSYPNLGHLVSLMLSNLEDQVGPVHVRCRLGDGTLLPELETHILGMKRGEQKLVKVHFPATTPAIPTANGFVHLAGQIRLLQVEVLDCKPFGLPPVLEDEFYVSQGVCQDMTQLTESQHASIAEGS